MSNHSSSQNVIVGGGIIGLSIAYELAKRGKQVVLLEQDKFGEKASWAGAGILTPANAATAIHPQEQLEALGHELHELWSDELKERTGIDNGFRKCGGLYVARSAGEAAALTGMMVEWDAREIECQPLDENELRTRFASFAKTCPVASSERRAKIRMAVWVPGESQFCNPHHLDALVAACRQLGVEMKEETGAATIRAANGMIESVSTAHECMIGENYFFAAGPWTQRLVAPTKIPLPMLPVRGQIALYQLPPGFESQSWPIINEGSRYLVPRTDGHVLAGATIEEVGFDCRTTETEVNELRAWAEGLSDALNESTFVKAWAGLRPGTYDGFAYLGRLGTIKNAFVAAGHFKCGLQLSTATAVVMSDLAEGKTPSIDLTPYSPSRVADHQSAEIR